MAQRNSTSLPINPLEAAQRNVSQTDELVRRHVLSTLESYNTNYDVLAEVLQNSMDAVEDAKLRGLPGPHKLQITINLKDNWLSVFDTGVGMTAAQVCSAFAPSASFKTDENIAKKRGHKNRYRGHKGVGLTFLAYGTNEIVFHSRQNGSFLKTRMRNGRDWVIGKRHEASLLVEDDDSSPLDTIKRGTFVKIFFSPETRPASLVRIGSDIHTWETIIRTRTAVGQILLGRDPIVRVDCKLQVIRTDGACESCDIDPEFMYPHTVKRKPDFRFLDVLDYHEKHRGIADHSPQHTRNDGIFLRWTPQAVREQLSEDNRRDFDEEIAEYAPHAYAFRPYQGHLWTELTQEASRQRRTLHLQPGLVLAVDRQRLADVVDIRATRQEFLARNVLAVVHFDGARPDYGRKTLQPEMLDLAQAIADRVVQYFSEQDSLLKPAGEKSTAAQREVELGHEEWLNNVRAHAQEYPLAAPPVSYVSEPLTEQDVVGLFHQLSSLGVFPGLRVYATSSQHTYDCFVNFDAGGELQGLRHRPVGSDDPNPLGLSTEVLSVESTRFRTKGLTLEFKNSLDGLIHEVENPKLKKSFRHIDLCVCWDFSGDKLRGYEIEEITESQNIYERKYPGVTHLLRRDGDTHAIQVIALKSIVELVRAGHVRLNPDGIGAVAPTVETRRPATSKAKKRPRK